MRIIGLRPWSHLSPARPGRALDGKQGATNDHKQEAVADSTYETTGARSREVLRSVHFRNRNCLMLDQVLL
eukprot:3269653-Pyramimonas_sp.AAC.1